MAADRSSRASAKYGPCSLCLISCARPWPKRTSRSGVAGKLPARHVGTDPLERVLGLEFLEQSDRTVLPVHCDLARTKPGHQRLVPVRLKRAFIEAVEAAFALGDRAKATELIREVEALQPGELTPFLRAHRSRLRARLDWV
jgi:hypothetical protein